MKAVGPSSSHSERLDLLSELRQSLVLAARRAFADLPRIEGIEHRAERLLSPILSEKPAKKITVKLEKLKTLLGDYSRTDDHSARRNLLAALSVLDSLEHLLQASAGGDAALDLELDLRRLEMSVQFLKGVGTKVAYLLAAKNIVTIEDLLFFLPRRYEDRRSVGTIGELSVGEFGQATGVVAAMGRSGFGFGRQPYEVLVQDATGTCKLTWFHYGARIVEKKYKVGDAVRFGGKVGLFRGRKQVVHPELEIHDPSEAPDSGLCIRAVYPEISGITAKRLNVIMQAAVRTYVSLIHDPLPDSLLEGAVMPDLTRCVRSLHLPGDEEDVDLLNSGSSPYHQRLAFDELFFVQLALAQKRAGVKRSRGVAHQRLSKLATRFYRRFPFKLTDAQRRVLGEIVDDLTSEEPMNRLLQGDVGSGKTIVAVLSALLVVENGRQVALMAPTEILAEQHFASIAELCDFEGVKVELLIGDMKSAQKQSVYEDISSGKADIVIGTHALIQKGVEFRDLGFVIVDEQHRFGVKQRSDLHQKGRRPDSLVMTATPIPRSLSMTLYGDLDVSVIDELPAGRRPISTELLWESEEKRVLDLLRNELSVGRQAYLITPLVSESEKLDLADAEGEYLRMKELLPEFRIGLLHGRMSGPDKERIMREFKDGAYDVLVSTTVVEVGVDVPNATVMVVRHAERFGLSQLHQLRGRVGRGEEASHCLLICEKVGEEARERLSIMEETTDGFLIAEKDLEIRGPGDFLGTRQVGVPLFLHANLVRDREILTRARKAAFSLVDGDPDVEKAEHRRIRSEFERRYMERLKLIGIG